MHHRCDFNSGTALHIGVNFGHVVLGVSEGSRRVSVGLTPESMRKIANELLIQAKEAEDRVLSEKSKPVPGEGAP